MWLSQALRTKGVRPIVVSIPIAALLFILGETLSVARVGTQFLLEFSGLFMGSAMMASILGILILPFVILFRRDHRRHLFVWLIVCVLSFPVIVISASLGNRIRMAAFEPLALRSQALVDAIRRYEDVHGLPPESLNALVPKFLEKIPRTGMMAYPDYEFEVTGEYAHRYERNPWILFVNTPSGGINFDRFIYFPLQNYPERGESGSYEKIHDWVYYHE